jgi:RNA polymerase sigma-70 factor (ECF subfamily)
LVRTLLAASLSERFPVPPHERTLEAEGMTRRNKQASAILSGGQDNPAWLASFEEHRGLLFSIAYRMLGSVSDAEDMVQEAALRWRRAASGEIRSPRAMLVTIVTRLCINQLQSARARREEYVGQWLPEPLVTGAGGDPAEAFRIDETVSMAFLVLLERLTPVERAVFLLREVFDYDYEEIAAVVKESEVHCRQILHRARQHVAEMRPRFAATAEERNRLLERFVAATGRGDMEGLLELLAEDVVLHSDGGGRAIAVPNLVRGADKVARGILGSLERLVPRNLLNRIVAVNGQPGIASYLHGRPYSVITLDVRAGRITTVYVLTNPEKLARLPDLPSAPS